MDIHQIRQELRHKNISDINLRVTFYARVSTDSDMQENSLKNQRQYYENYIKINPSWKYVEGYIDEGVSGLSTRKREKFNQMIADAKLGKFDYIITKEITRFARNTVDSIQYTRDLLRCGVAVLFQNDGINTIDEDSELRLTIMGGIAQDDSRRTSSRVKFGHKQAIKSGVVLGNSRIFGYDKQDKKLVINEEEAKMVRELFALYSTDQYSLSQITNILWDKGYKNRNGKKIWHNTLAGIIQNPKYKGYYCGGKVQITDMFTKQQRFLPEKDWVMWKDETGDTVPAIVDEEIWEAANCVFDKRSNEVKTRSVSRKPNNIYTSKIICERHNAPYYLKGNVLKDGSKSYYWVCSHKINNGAVSCNSIPLYENELNSIMIDLLKNLNLNRESVIDEYMNFYSKEKNSVNVKKEMEELEREFETIEKKKEKILEFNLDGKITDTEFIKRNNTFNARLEEIENLLEQYKKEKLIQFDLHREIKDIDSYIQKVLNEVNKCGEEFIINKQIVDMLIDKIFVSQAVDKHVTLTVKLKTSQTRSFVASRSGHILKKMIQSYEDSL